MSNEVSSVQVSRRSFALAGVGIGLAGVISGCGGAGKRPSRMRIGIDWTAGKSGTTRYVPGYANSIAIEAYRLDSPNIRTQVTVNRPEVGSKQITTIDLDGVYTPGTYMVALAARTLVDGGGETVATGATQAILTAGSVTNISITLSSVIASLVIYGVDVQVPVGSTAQLNGTALDPDGKVVLVPANYLTWKQLDGLDVVSMSATGVIEAKKPGVSTVQLSEMGAGQVSKAIIKVVNRSTINVWSQQYGKYDCTSVASGYQSIGFYTAPSLTKKSVNVGTINHIIAVSSNRVVVAGTNGCACIDIASDQIIWEALAGIELRGCPALSDNGRLVVPCMSGEVAILDPNTGASLKTILTSAPVTGSVSVVDTVACVGNSKGDVYSIDLVTSSLKHKATVYFEVTQPPLMTATAAVFVSGNARADGFNFQTGQIDDEVFQFSQGDPTAVVSARLQISVLANYWVIDGSGKLYCIDSAGNTVYEQDFGSRGFTPSVVYSDQSSWKRGFLLAPLQDGGLVVLDERSSYQKPAGWLGMFPSGSATVVGTYSDRSIPIAIVCGHQYIAGSEEVICILLERGSESVLWRLKIPWAHGQAVPCAGKIIVPLDNAIAILG